MGPVTFSGAKLCAVCPTAFDVFCRPANYAVYETPTLKFGDCNKTGNFWVFKGMTVSTKNHYIFWVKSEVPRLASMLNVMALKIFFRSAFLAFTNFCNLRKIEPVLRAFPSRNATFPAMIRRSGRSRGFICTSPRAKDHFTAPAKAAREVISTFPANSSHHSFCRTVAHLTRAFCGTAMCRTANMSVRPFERYSARFANESANASRGDLSLVICHG